MERYASARAWDKAKAARCTVDNKIQIKDYRLFKYYEEKYVGASSGT